MPGAPNEKIYEIWKLKMHHRYSTVTNYMLSWLAVPVEADIAAKALSRPCGLRKRERETVFRVPYSPRD